MINHPEQYLIEHDKTIKEALEKLNAIAADAVLLIVDGENKLLGSLSDGDVRRGIMNGAVIGDKIAEIMHVNPKFIRKGEVDISKVADYRNSGLKVIPILDLDNRIEKVVSFRELKSYLPLDAVIMAGGRGERLKPLTNDVPKPMLPVGSKPILERALEHLVSYGIDDVWISINYLGSQIQDYFSNGSDRNISISYIQENSPLGTIGSMSMIKKFKHDHILVLNSDLIHDIDYEKFYLQFLSSGADMAVLSIPYNVTVPYAVLQTNEGRIVSLQEKPTYTYYSNGGVYLMKQSVVGFIPPGQNFDTTDLIEKLIARNLKVVSYPHNGFWLDIGRIEDYKKANTIFEMKH